MRQDQQPPRDLPTPADDPVLADLRRVEAHYQEFRAEWERVVAHAEAAQAANRQLAGEIEASRGQIAALEAARAEALGARQAAEEDNARLAREVEAGRAQLARERERTDRQRARADSLAVALRDIHRALFSGNVYDLILKACLTITGATRGVYVTVVRGQAARTMRIRAAVDVDGYPQSPPSPFIRDLCDKVVAENDTLVCNEGDDRSGLPMPERTGERFHNLMVAPVVLLKHFNGIIIAADKPGSGFDEEDTESLLSVGDQAAVAVENDHLRRELQDAYRSTISVLADAVEAKDPYTHGHCETVSHYANLIARRLDLSAYDRNVVCYAALLHDIGKIGVSDGVLHKPGPLLPEERDLMRSHVRVGYQLLRNVPALSAVADVVLHHHEWYDGTGYPDGLRGEEISVASRIVCVVDSYCAMITRRSYKEAFSEAQARDELIRCSGSQFDPRIVETFLAILASPEGQRLDDEDEGCGVLPGFDFRDEERDRPAAG